MDTQNTNGNGNAQQTPDEVFQETVRESAPKLRRAVRSMKIPAGAKFLFDAILDDTFMYDFGGDTRGSMIASAKDLAARYGHDDETIKRWASVLIDCGVLHVTKSWPDQEWYITAIRKDPASRANMRQRARARAAGLSDPDKSDSVGIVNPDGKNALFWTKPETPGSQIR
jgi:hypothetical protein